MRTFDFKVTLLIVSAVAAAIIIAHSIIYLSIDAGSLSAQMPLDLVKRNGAGAGSAFVGHRN
jgi:ABC-type taurine transport system ATPase subunit